MNIRFLEEDKFCIYCGGGTVGIFEECGKRMQKVESNWVEHMCVCVCVCVCACVGIYFVYLLLSFS